MKNSILICLMALITGAAINGCDGGKDKKNKVVNSIVFPKQRTEEVDKAYKGFFADLPMDTLGGKSGKKK